MTPLLSAWSALTTVGAPVVRLMLRRRVWLGKEFAERLPERRGLDTTPRPNGRLVWLHAASVGESVSVLPVLLDIMRLAPDASLLLTTGTVTSAVLLERRLPEIGLSGRAIHRFVPVDVPRWVGRFLDHWRPDAAAMVESELWPNLLAGCRRRGIPMVLLNARMSDRSYRRWQASLGLARTLLGCFVTIQAQSGADAERLRALGAVGVATCGNLKFAAPALPVNEVELALAQCALRGRPCWVAASTHTGEEQIVLSAHRCLVSDFPELVTIIAPRHPERGEEIAAIAHGTPLARRSRGESPEPGGIWLADTLGELGLWYRLAGIALVGKSLLSPGGGQNPLEPARLGCAVAAGPFMANFAEPVRVLKEAEAITTVADWRSIAEWVRTMLRDPARREAAGERAGSAGKDSGSLATRAAEAVLATISTVSV